MSPDFDARSPEVEALIANDGPSGRSPVLPPISGSPHSRSPKSPGDQRREVMGHASS